MEGNGYSTVYAKIRMEEEGGVFDNEIFERITDIKKQNNMERIRKSKEFKKYERLITPEVPLYLRESSKKQIQLARIRILEDRREECVLQ